MKDADTYYYKINILSIDLYLSFKNHNLCNFYFIHCVLTINKMLSNDTHQNEQTLLVPHHCIREPIWEILD